MRTEGVKKSIQQLREENERQFLLYGFDKSLDARNTHLQSLLKRLAHIVDEFRRMEIRFVQQQKERDKLRYLIARPDASKKELQLLGDKEEDRPILQSMFTACTRPEKEAILYAERRKASIQGLLQGIEDLKEISDDFIDFISTNGSDVDRVHIEAKNTIATTESTEKTIQKVAIAQIRKKNITRFLFIVFLVMLLFLLIYAICRIK